jgi:hypothetical protein
LENSLSDNEKPVPPILEVVELWKFDCGIEVRGKGGSTFKGIPIPDRRGRLLDLIQAMVSFGYVREEIEAPAVSTKVVMTCWSDLIVNMTKTNLRKSRDITRLQWEEAIKEFFSVELPKFQKRETAPEYKKEPKLEKTKEDLIMEIMEPKDRLVSPQKIDRGDNTNWELLEELGIEPDSLENE